MGAGEENSTGGEAIDVGREGLRVSTETANPIVEVIDGDEEDIGLLDRVRER